MRVPPPSAGRARGALGAATRVRWTKRRRPSPPEREGPSGVLVQDLLVEDRGDLLVVHVGLVVPVVAGVDDLLGRLAVDRVHARLHGRLTDADGFLRDGARHDATLDR